MDFVAFRGKCCLLAVIARSLSYKTFVGNSQVCYVTQLSRFTHIYVTLRCVAYSSDTTKLQNIENN